jgi:phosphate-selective porin
MKKQQVILFSLFLLATVSTSFARSSTGNRSGSSIADLQREILELNERLDKIEEDREKIRSSSGGALSDIKFNGRLFIDFINRSNDEGYSPNLVGVANNRYTNLAVDTARLGFVKKLSDKSSFAVRFRVKSGAGVILDTAYFNYKITPKLSLDIGANLLASYGLMNESSTNDLLLLNGNPGGYSLWDLILASNSGAKLNYTGDNYGISVAVLGNGYSLDINKQNTALFNTRIYANPYKNGDNVIHIGASYYREEIDKPNAAIPTTGDNSSPYYDLKEITNFGFEFALNYNWFNLQAEYLSAQAVPLNKLYRKQFALSGSYVQATFSLTGETIRYGGGYFGSVKVKNPVNKGGLGAFELVFAFANSDLQDDKASDPSLAFDYGKNKEYAVALNWLPADYIRIILEYSRIEEKFLNGSVSYQKNGNDPTNGYNVIALKGKVFF